MVFGILLRQSYKLPEAARCFFRQEASTFAAVPNDSLLRTLGEGSGQLPTPCRRSQAHVLWPLSIAMPLPTCPWSPAIASHGTLRAPCLRAGLCALVHILLSSLGSATCPLEPSDLTHTGSPPKARLLLLLPPSLPP